MKKKVTFLIGVIFLIMVVWCITAIGVKHSKEKTTQQSSIIEFNV